MQVANKHSIQETNTEKINSVMQTAQEHAPKGYLGKHIIAEFFEADQEILKQS